MSTRENGKLVEWTKGFAVPSNAEIDEIIDRIAGFCLSPHFEEIAPEYPKFPKIIRQTDREEAVRDALKYLKGGLKTQRGDSVLDGLELLDGDQISPAKSRYAQYLLKLMKNGVTARLSTARNYSSQMGILSLMSSSISNPNC